jgi:hypothetical protein
VKIDWDKPIQTRDGRKARVVCRDKQSPDGLTHICLVSTKSGNEETVSHYTVNGGWLPSESRMDSDIINVPQEHEILVRVCKLSDRRTPCSCALIAPIETCLRSSRNRAELKEAYTVTPIYKEKKTIKEGAGL